MVVTITLFTSCTKTHLEYAEDVKKANADLKISQVVAASKLQEAVTIFDNDVVQKVNAEMLSKDFQTAWSEFKLSMQEQRTAFNEVEVTVNALFSDLDSLNAQMQNGSTLQQRQISQTSVAKNNFVKDANTVKAIFAKFDKIIEEGQDYERALISDAMLSSLSGHTSKIHGIAQQSQHLLKELESFREKTNSLLGFVETKTPAMAEVTVSAPVVEPSTPPQNTGSYTSHTELPSTK
jgi:beta-galactosidase/beta-glucuronidase